MSLTPRKRTGTHGHTYDEIHEAAEYEVIRPPFRPIPSSEIGVDLTEDDFISLNDWLYGMRTMMQVQHRWNTLDDITLDLDGALYTLETNKLFFTGYYAGTGLKVKSKVTACDWTLNPQINFAVRFRSDTNQNIWLIAGEPDNAKHIGFKVINNTLYWTSSDTTEAYGNFVLKDTTTIDVGTTYLLQCRLVSNQYVEWKVHVYNTTLSQWILSAMVKTTGSFPTSGTAYPCYISFYVGGTSGWKWMDVGIWYMTQTRPKY